MTGEKDSIFHGGHWAGPVFAAFLFVAQLPTGAFQFDRSLWLAAAEGLLLALLLFSPRLRPAIGAMRGMLVPGVLLGAVLICALAPLVVAPGSIDAETAVAHVVRLLALAGLFVAAAGMGEEVERNRILVRSLMFMGLAYAVLSLGIYLLAPGLSPTVEVFIQQRRLTATLYSPNTAAAFFGIIMVVALGSITQRLKEAGSTGTAIDRLEGVLTHGPWELMTLILAGICLGFTGGRTTLAATLIAVVVFLVWERLGTKKAEQSGVHPALPIVIVVAAVALGGGAAFARLGTASHDFELRMLAYRSHWPLITNGGWMGHGLGGFNSANALAVTKANVIEIAPLKALLNVYLQWLEQAGPLGAFCMFACIGWILVQIVVGAYRRTRATTAMRMAGAVSLLLLVQGLTDVALETPSISALWAVILGLGYGAASAPAGERRRRIDTMSGDAIPHEADRQGI